MTVQGTGDLEPQRAWLTGLIRREASPALRRLEAVEDLVQGVLVEALRGADGARWQSPEVLRAWLATVARRHLIARRRYWFSLRRGSARVLRRTLDSDDASAAWLPADSATGPSTFAARREAVERVARALARLLPLDRELLVLSSEGLPLEEVAERTGLSYAAAQRRRLRALERLRRILELLGADL